MFRCIQLIHMVPDTFAEVKDCPNRSSTSPGIPDLFGQVVSGSQAKRKANDDNDQVHWQPLATGTAAAGGQSASAGKGSSGK